MAGNLVISQINGGQIGFRNILINGYVNTTYEINQRTKQFTSASNGDYFADRWKRVNSNNMTQIIEEGSYNPSTDYCLSGSGLTTQVITSPGSGNWTLPNISRTASFIQLEAGDRESDFEWKPIGIEYSLCQRYYQKSYSIPSPPGNNESDGSLIAMSNSSGTFTANVTFNTLMRRGPTITLYTVLGATSTFSVGATVGVRGFYVSKVGGISGTERFHFVADAEL